MTPDYRCTLHSERKALTNPQGCLVCRECWERYKAERSLNLPFEERMTIHA